jgi:hypothetical protein
MAARDSGRLGAGVAGDSQGASYRLPVSHEINKAYSEAARAVIRTRLARAGARLA